jgi:hypothetical protein
VRGGQRWSWEQAASRICAEWEARRGNLPRPQRTHQIRHEVDRNRCIAFVPHRCSSTAVSLPRPSSLAPTLDRFCSRAKVLCICIRSKADHIPRSTPRRWHDAGEARRRRSHRARACRSSRGEGGVRAEDGAEEGEGEGVGALRG